MLLASMLILFFFNDTATTEIYTLSLHDALPISITGSTTRHGRDLVGSDSITSHTVRMISAEYSIPVRSEEHTSELQSHLNLLCRLLLEKKKNIASAATPSKFTV